MLLHEQYPFSVMLRYKVGVKGQQGRGVHKYTYIYILTICVETAHKLVILHTNVFNPNARVQEI